MSEETQKKESEEAVTKGYLDKKLDEKLEAFVTKDYLDEKLEAFVTKEYFKEYLDLRFDEFGETMDEKMRKQTVEFLRAVDKALMRFDVTVKDRSAHSALHERVDDDIHEHDKRIKKLEVAIG